MANIIATMMRDEDPLITDFIIHHLAIGFDKIIIFDDGSVTQVQQHVDLLPASLRAKVDCHRLNESFMAPGSFESDAMFDKKLFEQFNHSKQVYLCNYILAYFCRPTDWLALIDVDEFLELGAYGSIGALRQAVEARGFSAISLIMMIFGHGYNLTPPADNNIAAFIWRSEKYLLNGKYFAQAGAIQSVDSVHFPTLHTPGLFCNGRLEACAVDKCYTSIPDRDFSIPHLKHYMILDVTSCYKRRMRVTISRSRFIPAEQQQLSRQEWDLRTQVLRWTSVEADTAMACSIMLTRSRLGLDVSAHARALSRALEDVEKNKRLSGGLDLPHLRNYLQVSPEISDIEMLLDYFRRPNPDPAALRFFKLPADFDAGRYAELNPGLKGRSAEALTRHYLDFGRFEGRPY